MGFSTNLSMQCSHGEANKFYLLHIMVFISLMVCSHGSDFNKDFVATWGDRNVQIRDKGHLVELSLDREIGSRIQSKERYLYGRFDLEIKLAKGESAGTITSFYVKFLSSLVILFFMTNMGLCPYLILIIKIVLTKFVSTAYKNLVCSK